METDDEELLIPGKIYEVKIGRNRIWVIDEEGEATLCPQEVFNADKNPAKDYETAGKFETSRIDFSLSFSQVEKMSEENNKIEEPETPETEAEEIPTAAETPTLFYAAKCGDFFAAFRLFCLFCWRFWRLSFITEAFLIIISSNSLPLK